MGPEKYKNNGKWYVKYWGATWKFNTEAKADEKIKELCCKYIRR